VKLSERISLLEHRYVDRNIPETKEKVILEESFDTNMPETTKEKNSEKEEELPSAVLTKAKRQSEICTQKTQSFAEAEYFGNGFLSTFVNVLSSKLHAKIQFILLIICIAIFLWYGHITLDQAIKNEQSEFKPEKKLYTTDKLLEYHVPNIYLQLFIIMENRSEASIIMPDILTELNKSQNYFQERVLFRYYDFSVRYPNVSSSVEQIGGAVQMEEDFGVSVLFRLQVNESPRNEE